MKLLVMALTCWIFLGGESLHPGTPPSRRTFLQLGFVAVSSGSVAVAAPPPVFAFRQDISLRIEQAGMRLGLELMDVTINGKTVAAVKRVVVSTKENQGIQAGMILPDFSSAAAVQEMLQSGSYPIKLTFRNLAAGGDAIADDGRPLVTAQDALDLARKPVAMIPGATFEIKNLRTPSECRIQSRRGDVLEIKYDARMGSSDGIVYDASSQRGTGLPYQMVLGSGDMLLGVDQGLYDMCPGEARLISIPPQLAYGARGNKLYGIPGNTSVFWKVKLISVNSLTENDSRTRDELEGRVEY